MYQTGIRIDTRKAVLQRHIDTSPIPARFAFGKYPFYKAADGVPFTIEIDRSRLNARYLRCFRHESAQAVSFLIDYGYQLFLLRGIRNCGTQQSRRRRANRRERSLEFVCETIEERGLELFTLTDRLRSRGNFTSAHTLQRNSEQIDHRVQRCFRLSFTPDGKASNILSPKRNRRE